MKNCLIIINKASGGSRKLSFEKVEKAMGDGYLFDRHIIDDGYDINSYDTIAVCGGDGTLGSVLAKVYDKQVEVVYFPAGTLNDKAKSEKYLKQQKDGIDNKKITIGLCQKDGETKSLFSYVFAAGAFTPIGYAVSESNKKRFGVLAYLGRVVKEYKIHRINAKINYGEGEVEGEFALIMFLKSPRCFGFRFNRAYDKNSTNGHLIAIRSPKHGGLLGKIEMFFPFFRVFFMGLKKERDGKIIFKEVARATVSSEGSHDYCRDGEKQTEDSGFDITFEPSVCDFSVMSKF